LPRDASGPSYSPVDRFFVLAPGEPLDLRPRQRQGRGNAEVSAAPVDDFAGLTPAVRAGSGIGDLPQSVRPELMRARRLVEIMLKLALPQNQSRMYY
jgi:hypothetical protein